MRDYIIVGAGLSGIVITDELQNRGRTVLVFENGSQSSSTVAGGIFNPVILKRFTLAWNADSQLETAIPFYRSLEKKLSVNLLEELNIYRKFGSVEEQNNWFEATDKPRVSPFLDPHLHSTVNDNIPSSFSFGKVLKSGRIDTALLLKSYRRLLKDQGSLITEDFEYDNLKVEEGIIEYKGFKAKKIIFCEGFGMVKNPFFNFLPLNGNKGEYLIIKSEKLNLKVAVKSSVFILPLGNDLYKVGATYDNRDQSPDPTPEAREKLLQQLKKMMTCDFEVVGQVGGIRPATPDRKPLAGKHPSYSQMYCCNGFGSRGVLMAPTVAKELIALIEEGKALPEEMDLQRFLK